MPTPPKPKPASDEPCKICPFMSMITDGPITYRPIVPEGSNFNRVIKELKRINKQNRILEVTHEVITRSNPKERVTSYGCKIMGTPLTTKLTFIIQEP